MTATVLRRLRLTDRYGATPLGIILTILLSFLAVMALVVFLVVALSRPIGRTTCRNWSGQTGIPTKFVVLNVFDTGTCLARTPDGRWVNNSRVQVYIPGGKR